MKKAVWILSTLALGALVLPNFVLADTNPVCDRGILGLRALDPGCVDYRNLDDVVGLILYIVGVLRTIFWILAVGMIFYAAYLYLFGGAGEKAVGQAKTVLRYAIIAMVVALLATSIPWLIASIF
jgi:hypothetical protein